MIAVLVVHASTLQVSLLAMLGAATAVFAAVPLGVFVEFRRKRGTMIASDVARAMAQGSLPVAAAVGHVTYLHLCAVGVVNAAGNVAFTAASQAHLVDLVGREALVTANARLQATNWMALSVGPFAAGALIAIIGAPSTLLLDAVSFLVSAGSVASIATLERQGSQRPPGPRWRSAIAGFAVVRRDRVLRRLLLNWVVFAGCVGMLFPLETVFFLRDLHFSTLQYGAVFGVASAGAFVGSLMTSRVAGMLGLLRTIWLGSVGRAAVYFLIVAAPSGSSGFALCAVSMTVILALSAVVNTTITSLRQARTPDDLMSRVSSLWNVSTAIGQPVLIIVGGAIGAAVGNRLAMLVGATLIASSVLLLPRESPEPAAVGSTR